MTILESTLRRERLVSHSPEKIWKALTDPTALASWFMRGEFKPETGALYRFVGCEGEDIVGEVLHVEELSRLVFTWRHENSAVVTEVEWNIHAEAEGTRVTIEHRGFDGYGEQQSAMVEAFSQGWGGFMDKLDAFCQADG